MHLIAKTVRAAGISPLLVFFDATATTDIDVATSVTQDVTLTWGFGDRAASGKGTWAYGSNPSANGMNAGNGIVAAHLYRVAGQDAEYTASVTATDGKYTASCNLEINAYDPSGANGFPGAATTCVSASSKPTAGSDGCPAGAKVLQTASLQSALSSAYGNGKRVLFKCGNTFSGDTGSDNLTAVKWAIGAYGGCEDTQANRPIMSNSGPFYIFEFSNKNGNGTISDLDCEGNAAPNGGCIFGNDESGIMYQVTLYNLYTNNEKASFGWNQCSQCGMVQVFQNNIVGPDTEIGTYINIAGFKNYPYRGNTFNDVAYQAIIGSHFDGGRANYAKNAETVRIYGCQDCYIANNDFLNAGPYYAQLKLHAGGARGSWNGQYTEYVEISDNYFGGSSGANAVEISPENSELDERLRYIVVERNLFDGVAKSGRQLMISGVNITARNNLFLLQKETSFGIQICTRGVEPAPKNIEAFHNSFYGASGYWNAAAISVVNAGCGSGADPSESFIENNLGFFPGNRGGSIPMVAGGTGAGNMIRSNTPNTSKNPSWINASETMKKISDWKPTANYSDAVNVPVPYDAAGTPWSVTRELGALHH